MAYVVTENCIGCKHTNCVSVCPAECFYEGANFLAINPDECVSCGMCEPACPIGAIKPDDRLSREERVFIHLNKELSARWPRIRTAKAPLPDAPRWVDVPGKLASLKR